MAKALDVWVTAVVDQAMDTESGGNLAEWNLDICNQGIKCLRVFDSIQRFRACLPACLCLLNLVGAAGALVSCANVKNNLSSSVSVSAGA